MAARGGRARPLSRPTSHFPARSIDSSIGVENVSTGPAVRVTQDRVPGPSYTRACTDATVTAGADGRKGAQRPPQQ